MKVVAFVPIRLNSKRVVGKNLKLLGGKPLLCYVLESLLQVNTINEIYVYCSRPEIQQYLPLGYDLSAERGDRVARLLSDARLSGAGVHPKGE